MSSSGMSVSVSVNVLGPRDDLVLGVPLERVGDEVQIVAEVAGAAIRRQTNKRAQFSRGCARG